MEKTFSELEQLGPNDLITYINDCIQHDFNKLVQLLYRIDVSEEKLKYILQLNLTISVGKGHVFISSSDFNDNFEKSRNNHLNGIPLYIAKNQEYADKLRMYDEDCDDYKFGQFLSYPSCCIDFVKLNQKVPKLIEALKYLVIKNKYNVWCWPVASISDSSLLTHFPCSFNCVESQQLSKTRFKLLTKYGSEFLINKIVKYHTLNYYIENQKIKFTSDNNVSFISPNESINEL